MNINGVDVMISNGYSTEFKPAFHHVNTAGGAPVVTDKGSALDEVICKASVFGRSDIIQNVYDNLKLNEAKANNIIFSNGEYCFGPLTPAGSAVSCLVKVGDIDKVSLNVYRFNIELRAHLTDIIHDASAVPSELRATSEFGCRITTKMGQFALGDGSFAAVGTSEEYADCTIQLSPMHTDYFNDLTRFFYVSNRGKVILEANAPQILGLIFPEKFQYPCDMVIRSITNIERWGRRWTCKITLAKA